ncbi:hypothetical protein [Bizionia paragorgiae]|uniref:Uncharacterized protein n=1 Tax=Bizionia paragorgiae TaxID=283786 RepID=A0A1H3YQ09_BIZPA|nr:hypothetical protein [Bizionia paragorgiae]SEA13261.1 hypothetical protein SAMN04487990_10723 [Bizionia paragorgiae]
MKTKFVIDLHEQSFNSRYDDIDLTGEDLLNIIFTKAYLPHGFIRDTENTNYCYKIFDKEINITDKKIIIIIAETEFTIEAKFQDIENDMLIYHLDE